MVDLMQLLVVVGLVDDVYILVGKYFKGMQMWLIFVRLLINDLELLFFDEFIFGLDLVNVCKIKDIIVDLKVCGCMIFFIMYDMVIVDELCDWVVFVVDGRIVVLDSFIELKIVCSWWWVWVEYWGDGGGFEIVEFGMDGFVDDLVFYFVL